MVLYRGVVKGNIVILQEPTHLLDGSEVEVELRPTPPDLNGLDEEAAEDAFERYLLEIGVISRIPSRRPDLPGMDREPVEIEGPPLSQLVIEERR